MQGDDVELPRRAVSLFENLALSNESACERSGATDHQIVSEIELMVRPRSGGPKPTIELNLAGTGPQSETFKTATRLRVVMGTFPPGATAMNAIM